MNSAGYGIPRTRRRAISMVFLMLLYSLSALAFSPVATAHASNVAEWPMSGSNDTGWVLIESTGADPSTQTMATGDMFHNFAPLSLIHI